MSARLSGSQIHFLSLQTAIFCVQCELISANNTPRCLACGSKAVLGLSRLFGGSLRGQAPARLIEDDELNSLVRQLLCTVPGAERDQEHFSYAELHREGPHEIAHQPYAPISKINLEPAIGVITER